MSARVEFAHALRRRLDTSRRIVVDPDSRMTQLGLVPLAEPERTFHFRSRTASHGVNLTELTDYWLRETFGQSGEAYIAPERVAIEGQHPRAAVSLGTGGNECKGLGAEFEANLLRALAERYSTVWIDRGAGGEEAERVNNAAERVNAAADHDIRFWEGSFAGFASIISQCDFYAGYDSAGQHAAAAARTPLVTFFAGAPSERFRERWTPQGAASIHVMINGSWTLGSLRSLLAESSS